VCVVRCSGAVLLRAGRNEGRYCTYERDVALRRVARCSAAVCLLLANCSPVALCHPQVGHHGGCSEDRRHRVCSLSGRGSGDTSLRTHLHSSS
jgi:hypothetical protein